jgi:hypothetical protein
MTLRPRKPPPFAFGRGIEAMGCRLNYVIGKDAYFGTNTLGLLR